METFILFLWAITALLFVFLIKNHLTYKVRIRAIDELGVDKFNSYPSYDAMLFSPFKWTYKQHFGENK